MGNPLDILIPSKPGKSPSALYGTVTSTSPLRVTVPGSDDALPVTPKTLVACTVGDQVTCQIINQRLTVIGIKDGPKRTAGDFTVSGALTSDKMTTGPISTGPITAPGGTEIDEDGNLYVQGEQVKPGDPDHVTTKEVTVTTGSGWNLDITNSKIQFNDPGVAGPHYIDAYGSALRVTGASSLYLVGGYSSLTLGSDDTGAFVQAYPIYQRTYTGSANVFVTNLGTVGRATSLRRFKLDIESARNTTRVLDLRPVTYRDKGAVDRGEHAPTLLGLIAEEVAPTYPELATYDEDGNLNGVAYDRVGVALLDVVKDLAARVTALEQREH